MAPGHFLGLFYDPSNLVEKEALRFNSGMRKELDKKALVGVKVLEGEASKMHGIESQSVDAVIAAQV